MSWISLFFTIPVFSAIGGCTLGFVPTGLEPAKAQLEYWEKSGMTGESRLRESAQCGGGYTLHTGFSQQTVKAAQLPNETGLDTYRRLYLDWQNCMRKKGYHYTEK